MRRRLAEISSSEKSMWNSITAQEQESCRDFVPMLGQSTRTAIYFGAPGARQGQVLFDARLGRSHRRLLPAQGRNARMQQRYRCRPGAQSEETGTMGQLYYPAAFFSYPAIMYFTAGVAGVFTALHHMWKASCKQGKKKVWVHGLLQRVPRLVGYSLEKLKESTYSTFSFYFPKVSIPGFWNPLCTSFVQINPHPFHAPRFPVPFFFRGPNQMRGQQESSARRHPSCTCCWRRAGENCAQ